MLYLQNKHISSEFRLAIAGNSCGCYCGHWEDFLFSWDVVVPQDYGFKYSYYPSFLNSTPVITLFAQTEQHILYRLMETRDCLYSFYVSVKGLYFRVKDSYHHILRHCQDHLSIRFQKIYQQVNNLRL